ncbi:MAG: hypothetical protein PHS37_10345, partial [Candidatus Omnitrophica bacterium]|nr:hypothetical protein [Candidatus Omnitrophota bacterium]
MKNERNHIYTGLVAVCVMSLLLVSYMLFQHIWYKFKVLNTAKSAVQAETDRIVTEIDTIFFDISSA